MSRSDRAPLRAAVSIGSLLRQVLDDRDMSDRLSRYQTWLIWDQIVGEQIARRARPLRLRGGILEVRVDNPVWMQQLQMLKPKILQKLNDQLPEARIEDIYLRRGSHSPEAVSQQPPAHPPAWKRQPLTPAEQDAIETDLANLNDPELKAELRRLFSLQKQLLNARHQSPEEES